MRSRIVPVVETVAFAVIAPSARHRGEPLRGGDEALCRTAGITRVDDPRRDGDSLWNRAGEPTDHHRRRGVDE